MSQHFALAGQSLAHVSPAGTFVHDSSGKPFAIPLANMRPGIVNGGGAHFLSPSVGSNGYTPKINAPKASPFTGAKKR